jgi:small conductance mechanosensitive channel
MPEVPMLRFLPVMLLALLVLTAAPAAAQLPLGLPGSGSGSGAAEPQSAEPGAEGTAGAEARALIEVLRDDRARAALIAELERLSAAPSASAEDPPAEGGTAPAPEAPAADPDLQPTEPTVGEQLATLSAGVVDHVAEQADDFMRGVRATTRRLSVLWGPRSVELLQPLRDLALILVITVVFYAVLRWISQRLYRAASGPLMRHGAIGRIGLGMVGGAVDVLALVLSYAAGTMVVFASQESGANAALTQSLYLNAFLLVELSKVVLGVLIAPKRPEIRLLPLSDGAARYWTGRTGGLASILGYGLMLVVPVIDSTISFFTARAISVVVLTISLLWAMALVIRHRRKPSAFMARRSAAAGGPDAAMRLTKAVVAVWHWPALAYLLTLFILSVEASGNVGPFLVSSLKVAAALMVGVGINVLLLAAMQRGLRLSETVKETLPLLEDRLNGFLRSLFTALRLLVVFATIAAMIDLAGVVNVPLFLDTLFGRDLAMTLLSVGVIVVVSFLIWLGLASWVDYRLNPGRAVAATAREATLLTLMRNAVTIALVVIAAMVSLSELGLDIAPLLASAGVLGLAIGFGSQKLVQDIITGVFIQFEAAMNVGDVVTVGGTTGVVEKLTIRSVSLRDLQGVFHIIPFSSVDMVSNYMKDFSFHVADIGIAYREDVTEAKELMFKAFDDLREMPEFSRVIIGPLDWHGVAALGDSAVTLRARIRTRPGQQWAVGRAYNEAVKRRFDAAGVEIPFPHMTVWFGENKSGGAPPVHLASNGPAAIPRESAPSPISTTPFGQDEPNVDEGVEGTAER